MSKATIGGKIVIEGEGEYRKALKNIAASQRELRSEMELSRSTFAGQQNSMEALEQKCGILTKQMGTQAEKMEVYRQAIAEWGRRQEEAAGRILKLRAALEQAEQEMAALRGGAEESSEAVREQEKAIKELKDKLEAAGTGYDKASQKVSYYQAALNTAQAEQQGLQRDLDRTEGYLEEAGRSADGCAKSIDEYGNRTKEAADKTSVFGDVLKASLLSEAITEGIRKLADGIGRMAASAEDAGSSFEASLSQVAATMGMTAEEIRSGSRAYDILSEAAKDCGKKTKFSASESAEALNYLALAGYDAEKSVRTLPKVLDLAAAGGMDLAYASDLVTDSMAALGMGTDKLDMYIDQMARTSQRSNTSVAQLGEATLVCAGTVSMAKQSLVTMNTELGILADNGIKGAEGGTHLRNIILRLAAPTDTAAVAIEKLRLKISDSNGDMRDLNDIMTDLSSAMEGMSSSEKTRIMSQIFNKTDIAAVNALIKGTGEEFEALSGEIMDSSGAARAMADTLNDNLKGKVTILQSALEGLGISAYEIFDEGLKGAVDAATGAVGRLQRSVDSGDLRISLNRLGASMEEFVGNALDIGEEALPVMIEGLSWVLDNSDKVAAGVAGIAAAGFEMNVVAPLVQNVTAAWNAYKTANDGATVSQWLLNSAMEANPAGILITAVVGLTAAMAAYAALSEDGWGSETAKRTREMAEEARGLNEEYARSAEERSKAREELSAEADVARGLTEELKGLQAKTSLTAEEQARMRMIVEELNQLVPELNLAIDDQTGKLNMSTEAIENNIEKMMAMARVEAAREDSVRIAKEQYEAEKRLKEMLEQLEEQERALIASTGKLVNIQPGMREKDAHALLSAFGEDKKACEELRKGIEDTQAAIDALGKEYADTVAYITEQEAEAEKAFSALSSAAEDAGDSIGEMAGTAEQELGEMYEEMSEVIAGQIDLFSKFRGETELTAQELLENMQSQVDGITEWSENLSRLAERGIDQGLLKHLADLGPSGAGYVAAFVSMSEEELEKANGLFEEAVSMPLDATDRIVDAYTLAGENTAKGFGEGIEGGEGAAEAAAKKVGKASLDMLMATLEEHSPSKATERMGRNFDEGFRQGIAGGTKETVNAARIFAGSVLVTTQGILHPAVMEDAGRRLAAGLAQGIRGGRDGVLQAVREMCTLAVEEAKGALDIHSPSGKFRYLGEMSGEGFAEGWRKSVDGIGAMIADAMPHAAFVRSSGQQAGAAAGGGDAVGHVTQITQEINIYSRTDDPLEEARKFRQAQREAAEEW